MPHWFKVVFDIALEFLGLAVACGAAGLMFGIGQGIGFWWMQRRKG